MKSIVRYVIKNLITKLMYKLFANISINEILCIYGCRYL